MVVVSVYVTCDMLLQRYIESFSSGFDEGFKHVKVLFMQSGKMRVPSHPNIFIGLEFDSAVAQS